MNLDTHIRDIWIAVGVLTAVGLLWAFFRTTVWQLRSGIQVIELRVRQIIFPTIFSGTHRFALLFERRSGKLYSTSVMSWRQSSSLWWQASPCGGWSSSKYKDPFSPWMLFPRMVGLFSLETRCDLSRSTIHITTSIFHSLSRRSLCYENDRYSSFDHSSIQHGYFLHWLGKTKKRYDYLESAGSLMLIKKTSFRER